MGGAGATWTFSGQCLVVRLGLWRVCLGFFGVWRPVEWVWAVLPRGSCLLGVVGHFLCFSGGLWVLVSPLMLWLCYWGAYLGACAAGLWLLRLFLDFLLGGFGMIKTTQIIQFAILPHKVGNADAKCHEVKFSNKCCFFVRFFFIICKYVFSNLDNFVNVVFVVQRPIWACHCN